VNSPRQEWFPSDHGQRRWANGEGIEIFCEDDDDYPYAKMFSDPCGEIDKATEDVSVSRNQFSFAGFDVPRVLGSHQLLVQR
jgi:hypothetical protein